ncbi:hypothetical protein [Tenacibaculum jejuense]|uniref:Uncharacterized protein n=1 Tax=Tenacibaculum jejuense TaxID=584609 RepID=A0A238U7Y8_9FLAO|nr:hypothetical protein [Tenacibaculum jejuense]SNR14718.1 conserved protein of unknown function [Tenacibaculum jejuense]
MRDKNRIPKILKELERIWKSNPDFRLGQLIVVGANPKEHYPEIFYIEDEDLLDRLLKFDKRAKLDNEESKTVLDWKRFPNVSRLNPKELTIELLEKLIIELKNSDKKIVITPINLMKLNGAPVSDQTWLLNQKPRIKKLKKLLFELKENGLLKERKSKQDFLGIKEVGYDIVE